MAELVTMSRKRKHSKKLSGKRVTITNVADEKDTRSGYYYASDDRYIFNLSHEGGFGAFFKARWIVEEIIERVVG